MSKMRESFEKHCKTYAQPLNTHRSGDDYGNGETAIAWNDFKAGYQAAIAAIREGGPVAFEIDTNNQSFIPQRVGAWLAYDVEGFKSNMAKCLSVTNVKPLYPLPDDLT